MKSNLMRRLSILLVLAMVLAMLPVGAMAADSTILYLQPNSNWTQGNARFAAYFFGTGNTWADMTDADGDGIYEVAIPEGSWTHVIFCRMNPNAAANNWNNKWNQTGDLALPTDGNNFYAVPSGSWDGSKAAWGTFTAGDEVTEAPAPVYNYDYYVIGTMNSWGMADDALGMTDADGDGIYTLTIALAAGAYEYKINVGDWSKEFGDGSANFKLSLAEACDVTFTLNPATGEVTAVGAGEGDAPALEVNAANVKGNFAGLDFDEASEAGAMTLVDGIYTATFTAVPASAVGAEAYKFKVMVNNSWNTAFPSDDWTFYLTDACDVTITYNPANNEVTLNAEYLTYDAPTEGGEDPVDPPITEDVFNVKGDVAGLDWDLTSGTGLMTKNEDGSYSLVIADVAAATKYSIKVVKNNSWEGAIGGTGTGGNYEFAVNAACDVTITLSADGKLSVSGDGIGEAVLKEIVIESVYVAGNGDGSDSGSGWLNGVSWNPGSSVNQMRLEEGSTTVYSITYYGIAAGTYEFKFALNGTWDYSYASGVQIVSGETATAWFNPMGNSSVVVAEDNSTVTLVLDLTDVKLEKDNAKMTVTVEAPAGSDMETSAPESLVLGNNDFVIATGDRNFVTAPYTATFTGTLYIKPSAMTVINWMGEVEEVPSSAIGMQFMRGYSIIVDGAQFYGDELEVVEGQTYQIGFADNMGAGAWITLTLCSGHEFVDGACSICGYTCEYHNWDNGTCLICGAVCAHETWEDGWCTGCWKQCENHTFKYDFANGYHTFTCTGECGCVISGEAVAGEKKFAMTGASPVLKDDIVIKVNVRVPSGFSDVYAVFNFHGEDYYYYGDVENGAITFAFDKICPMYVGDNFKTTIYATFQGQTVAIYKESFSMLEYAVSQLNKTSISANLRTALSDLLVYAEKAQLYFDWNTENLVTEGLDAVMTPTTYVGPTAEQNKQALVGDKSSAVDFRGATVMLQSKIVLRYSIKTADPYAQTYKITVAGATYEFTGDDLVLQSETATDMYYLYFDVLKATQFDETIVCAFYDGETQVGRSAEYSVNTYVYQSIGKAEGELKDVLMALYNYGEAASNL